MDVTELERLAGSGAEMPDGLNSAEQMYYNGLSYLYGRHRAGDITKEEGANYKRKMRAASSTSWWQRPLLPRTGSRSWCITPGFWRWPPP